MTHGHAGELDQAGDWLWRLRPEADGPRPGTCLVCFPHAGGSASYFRPLAYALPPSVEVWGVQYPGRQDRRAEPVVEDLHVLADRVFEVLRRRRPAPPLVLFGHSMGAIVAFEVASRMERSSGAGPVALMVSGRAAPRSARRHENIHTRGDEAIIAHIRELSGTDRRMLEDEELVRIVLPTLRGDYKAVETYQPRPAAPLDCPVSVFIGDADPQVDLREADEWRNETTGKFRVREFPGGHFYLNDHVDALARGVMEDITAYGPVTGGS